MSASTSFGDGELEPGRVIERYEVQRLLGAGAMAAVYLVRHTQLDTLSALKILTLSKSKQLKKRLIQEGVNQARLEHPNVVRVFDVLKVDDMPALVMEYVDGPAMDEWLDENRPDLAEAERLFREVVEGVAEAHRAGLVHRDLKPANILMSPGPEGPIPKVADFGIAKAWADEDAVSMTRAGVAMGTPQYMAPEQATDAKDVDHRADIFALGCILYELVCGTRAFDGENLPTIFQQVLTGDYQAPNKVIPSLPGRFRSTIDACLAIDPSERPQSCEELLACLDTEPVPSPSMPPVAVEEAGRLSIAVGGVLGLLGLGALAFGLFVAAGAGYYVWSSDAAATDTDEPVEEGTDEPTDPDEDAPDAVPATGPCAEPAGQVVGYANVRGPVFLPRKGAIWYPVKHQRVHVEYPNEGNGMTPDLTEVCTLPAGAAVHLAHDPFKVKGTGWWIPIEGGSVGK